MTAPRVAVLTVVVALAITVGAVAARTQGTDMVLPPGFGPGPVTAATPLTTDWADAVDGLVAGSGAGSAGSRNPCLGDRADACFEAVVGEMEARLDRLGCSHTAPFAFTYLEMTRGVQRGVTTPGYFRSPGTIGNIDALFAQMYFDAIDNWEAGRHDDVPGAWRVAFQVADEQTASAPADLLLGMNAHITRDLAYTVALAIEAGGELTDDRSDFDRVNDVIADVRAPMLRAAGALFDPSLSALDLDLGPDIGFDAVDLIARWRDEAFELGQRLAAAGDAEERLTVITEIERNAVASAALILNADATSEARTSGAPTTAAERRAHCEAARRAD